MTNFGYALNDIAIIKLSSPVHMGTTEVMPLCLPGERLPSGTDECYIMGFGKTCEFLVLLVFLCVVFQTT